MGCTEVESPFFGAPEGTTIIWQPPEGAERDSVRDHCAGVPLPVRVFTKDGIVFVDANALPPAAQVGMNGSGAVAFSLDQCEVHTPQQNSLPVTEVLGSVGALATMSA